MATESSVSSAMVPATSTAAPSLPVDASSSMFPAATFTAPASTAAFAPGSSIFTAPLISSSSPSPTAPFAPFSVAPTGYQPYAGYQPHPHAGYPPYAGYLVPFPGTPTPGVVTIASAITIRLTGENYLIWRAQVAPLLRSHLLMGYVDGSSVCPAAQTVVDHGGVMVPQPNPLHQHWVQQDQAILSAFVSSMSEGVVGMVMFATTSREAWETLAGAFAANTVARSSGIRQQMAELKKRDMTVTVYFHKMKALADELTSIGQPLHDVELISYIMGGLGNDFDALYEVVNARTTPMPIRDLYSQLLATEQRRSAQRAEAGLHYPAAFLSEDR